MSERILSFVHSSFWWGGRGEFEPFDRGIFYLFLFRFLSFHPMIELPWSYVIIETSSAFVSPSRIT